LFLTAKVYKKPAGRESAETILYPVTLEINNHNINGLNYGHILQLHMKHNLNPTLLAA